MPKECCKKMWSKLPDDEPVFTLRAQDATAPLAVEAWARVAAASGVSPEKVKVALAHAQAMREWQAANPDKVKLPD